MNKALGLLGLGDAELSVLLVNDSRMRALNSTYRSINKTTDVLSFPQIQNKKHPPQSSLDKGGLKGGYSASCIVHHASFAGLILGDIVINIQAAKRQALEHGFSFNEEVRWLGVHGLLHLIGYDHEKSKYAERKMRQKEKELLEYMSGKDMN